MRRPRPALLGVVGLMGLGWLACGPGAEDIAEARTRYVAALDGFMVRQKPVPGADPSTAPQLEQDVTLDLMIRRQTSPSPPRMWARRSRTWTGETPEGLPGITLDVDQVDAAGKSRRHWRVWVETAGLAPGREIRAEKVLDDVDFAPGDGFRVEVRHNISAAERAQYAEWGAAATSSGPAS
jgi:hypothetical protein